MLLLSTNRDTDQSTMVSLGLWASSVVGGGRCLLKWKWWPNSVRVRAAGDTLQIPKCWDHCSDDAQFISTSGLFAYLFCCFTPPPLRLRDKYKLACSTTYMATLDNDTIPTGDPWRSLSICFSDSQGTSYEWNISSVPDTYFTMAKISLLRHSWLDFWFRYSFVKLCVNL